MENVENGEGTVSSEKENLVKIKCDGGDVDGIHQSRRSQRHGTAVVGNRFQAQATILNH